MNNEREVLEALKGIRDELATQSIQGYFFIVIGAFIAGKMLF